MPPQDQPEDIWRGVWLGRGADQGHRAVPLEQLQVGIEVVRRRHGVEDEVEAGAVVHINYTQVPHDVVGSDDDWLEGLSVVRQTAADAV